MDCRDCSTAATLAELVERAREGEKIGITDVGTGSGPCSGHPAASLKDIFEDIEKIRKRAKLGRGVKVRDLIEEGRTERFYPGCFRRTSLVSRPSDAGLCQAGETVLP